MDIPEIVKDSFGSLEALYARARGLPGWRRTTRMLDKMTSGLQASDLVIIAARPSMGKTAFAMNIAENAAIDDSKVVGVFSLEMSREALLMRMLCSQAQVDSHKTCAPGFLSKDDMRKLTHAMEQLMQAPSFHRRHAGHFGERDARQGAASEADQKGARPDHRRLSAADVGVPIGGKRFENRTQEVSAISRGLKALAKELNVPVVALSQLSRAPESRGGDHRPQLSDLRESGSIEQDADLVVFIFREEVYKKDDPELEGMAEIIIAKQRNGPIGTVKMAFLKSCTRFESLAEGGMGDEE